MPRHGGWPPSGFGVVLRRERARAGLTAEALAQRAGCSRHTVNKLEYGTQEPAWPLALALADALGISVQVFADGRGEEPLKRQRGRPRKGNPPPNT